MKRMKIISILTYSVSLLMPHAYAMEGGGGGHADPLHRLDYRYAFDQSKIHEKNKPLMVAWGCATNVFDDKDKLKTSEDIDDSENQKLLGSVMQTQQNAQKVVHEKEFENACLKKLKAARSWTITEPARESLTLLALMAGAAGVTTGLLGEDSMGGSFSVFAVLFNSVWLLRDTTRSCYNLAFPPAHPLTLLEERFAKNQCFIPKALWPVIIEKFMLARQNQFEQRKAMDFIEFALGLTTFKPIAEIQLHDTTTHDIIKSLHTKIDTFFADYDDQSHGEYGRFLKINISKFIMSLMDNQSETPRYLYLYGPGGIGKTYFVNQLHMWINNLIPDSMCFEELIISSADELEGNAQRPGAFLRVLRNQLMDNKRGSLVFMDEATWLNRDDMISSSKRVFNGDQSKLSTKYFGDGIDGTGINVHVPPMLIFVACNEDIKDAALKSRFDIIKYPLPKPEALAMHALAVAQKSSMLREAVIPSLDEMGNWLNASNIKDFRAIRANVEQYVLSQNK